MKQRDYKFRAWDDKEKKWLLGYDMPHLGGFSLFGETVLLGEWSAVLDAYIFDRDGHKQDDLKVMQFTGIKDAKGKEIYEGDIVKNTRYEGNAEIIWNSDVASKYDKPVKGLFGEEVDLNGFMKTLGQFEFRYLQPKQSSFHLGQFEVIGNVWENPELLTP